MKRFVIASALALLVPSIALAATKNPPSACVGLDQNACCAKPECTWAPALVKGQKSPITGKDYVRDRKAHCRKGRTPATPAKQPS